MQKEIESKTDRFSRLAEARTNKALNFIRLIGNLALPLYDYSNQEVSEIIAALRTAIDKAEDRLLTHNYRKKGKRRFRLDRPECSWDIRWIAYQLYKQDWLNTHVTNEQRVQAAKEYQQYRQSCPEFDDPVDSFDVWLRENGFGGSLYACFDEFCCTDYLDSNRILELFYGDEQLITLYKQDIADIVW